ncbi:MAG: GspH/FimT family pseudopilin [Methylococcales bacterium]
MRQTGFSFIEIMVVVTILGIVAAVAMPGLSTDFTKLDTAVTELSNAISFARSEAIRTRTAQGIEADVVNNQLRVYSMPASIPVYSVYHPIDKKLYTIDMKTSSQLSGVRLSNASFVFKGGFSSSSLLTFNANGAPKYSSAGKDYMLTSATITVVYKNQQRTLSIAPMTGRVIIQ